MQNALTSRSKSVVTIVAILQHALITGDAPRKFCRLDWNDCHLITVKIILIAICKLRANIAALV